VEQTYVKMHSSMGNIALSFEVSGRTLPFALTSHGRIYLVSVTKPNNLLSSHALKIYCSSTSYRPFHSTISLHMNTLTTKVTWTIYSSLSHSKHPHLTAANISLQPPRIGSSITAIGTENSGTLGPYLRLVKPEWWWAVSTEGATAILDRRSGHRAIWRLTSL
jgi:hypothetical protein